MRDGTVRERLVALTAEDLGRDREQIRDESSLERDLDADSLDLVGLVGSIEDEFSIDLPRNVEASWRTFGDMLATVEAQL